MPLTLDVMDTHAARRARRNAFKADLTDAYTDEEATPPEWLDLFTDVREASAELRKHIAEETKRFVEDADIRNALARRDRTAHYARHRAREINTLIKRLNLLAPQARFTRPALDADELLRPLYRSSRIIERDAPNGG